ncbi:glycosyltransferase family 4 protein [Luminiphilus sp.]|nr:glycosyltransferase family 4 protein [Luminiphilus sp.]
MRIVLINSADSGGGAARAAMRLHLALLSIGVDSTFLVSVKSSNEPSMAARGDVIGKGLGLVRPFIDRLPLFLYPQRQRLPFSCGWLPARDMVKTIRRLAPDIVHVHWIGGGTLSIGDLKKISAPIVWSLHDMAPFTGGCHYAGECERFTNSCGACPQLGSRLSIDMSSVALRRKIRSYTNLDIQVVGLSRWLASEASRSAVFKNCNVQNLPNPIDTDKFAPLGKNFCREMLGLPKNKKIILFGAMSATHDLRKGWLQMRETVGKLKEPSLHFVVFGSGKPTDDLGPDLTNRVTFLGQLHDDISLRIAYSAANVFVLPSLQENLANTAMEALACGTPVAAFNIGGNQDLVQHKETGYLARPYDTDDLADGIKYLCIASEAERIQKNTTAFVAENFSFAVVAEKYKALYAEVLMRDKKRKKSLRHRLS